MAGCGEHAASIPGLGVDHVCIGTDTKLTPPSPRPGQQGPRVGERTNQAWPDQTAGFYYSVVDAMLKTGFTQDEIGKIGGGNFLRVFGAAVSK
jgi:membrane dipeptidase